MRRSVQPPQKTLVFQQFPFRSSGRSEVRRGVPGPRGFTLIEIIVVITIMAIMAALIVPRVVGRTDDAKVAAAKQDIATLMNALKLYRLDNGRYPTTEQGLRALVEKPTVDPIPPNWKAGGYLDAASVHKDPWLNEYQFLNPGLHGEIDVMSFGRDGQPGGEGPDADIGSWMQ
jgi:general secretion pathway protein G